jgi:hypothetical protein
LPLLEHTNRPSFSLCSWFYSCQTSAVLKRAGGLKNY